MPELVTRLGAVITSYDAAAVVSALAAEPGCDLGVWRMFTNRWELWSTDEAGRRRQLLAAIDVAHDLPYPFAATLTRVQLSDAAMMSGLTPETVCDAALSVTGSRLADCPRTHAPAPPVFTGQRRTDRGAWLAEQRQTELAVVAAAPVAAANDEEPAGPALTPAEDRELRRLHYLATFGGLTGGLAGRYSELRNRDRRAAVRDPHDDELVVLPRQRPASHDSAVSTVLWESTG